MSQYPFPDRAPAYIIGPNPYEFARIQEALRVATKTLEQIADTPRNAGARMNAIATLTFLREVLKAGA